MIINKGDILSFGKYEGEDIKWIVYKSENDYLSLITQDVLFIYRYSLSIKQFLNWDESDLYSYINDELYTKIFSEKEQSFLLEIENDEQETQYKSKISIPNLNTIKLLGKANTIAKFVGNDECCPYWLSETLPNGKAMYVTSEGEITLSGKPFYKKLGVRICIYITKAAFLKEELLKYDIADVFEGKKNELNLGTYNGNKITWKTINRNNYVCTLICDHCLFKCGMNDDFYGITWEESKIRHLLNDELYENMFNTEEKKYIANTDTSYCTNPYEEETTYSVTQDNIKILDEKLYSRLGANDKIGLSDDNTEQAYWLMNPASTLFRYKYVLENGKIGKYGERVYQELWVRPVICIYRHTPEYFEKAYSDLKHLIEIGNNEKALEIVCDIKGYKDTEDIYYSLIKKKIKNSKGYVLMDLGTYTHQETGISTNLKWYAFKLDDKSAILFAETVLEWKPFNSKRTQNNLWSSSSIRQFLNGDFYKTSFNEKEKKIILKTDILENKLCKDYVFLPSLNEVKKYLKPNPKLYIVKPSEILTKVYNLDEAGYLTRTARERYTSVIYAIKQTGDIWGEKHVIYQGGIRPALIIKLD